MNARSPVPASDEPTARPVPDDGILQGYAMAAARLQGLDIPDEWWPRILSYLRLALEQTAALRAVRGLPDDPAAVFCP
ncbi:MAG TPA: hypothetical protein VFN61_06655 [Acidimicrobiales bacterium]|nr:hypothetical protein [Acidimicrobiales bacterium]